MILICLCKEICKNHFISYKYINLYIYFYFYFILLFFLFSYLPYKIQKGNKKKKKNPSLDYVIKM